MTGHGLRAEVLVVGGGPAGSALAGILAREGRDVVLVDRASLPRPKACGECLNPGGVEALERLGLLDAILGTHPSRIRGWDLHTPRGTRAPARFGGGWAALGVERASFDATLFGEARLRGARVREGVRIVDVEPGSGTRPPAVEGVTSEGEPLRIRADLLVGADGLRSVVARATGAIRRRPRTLKASFTWRVLGRGPSNDVGRLLLGSDRVVGLAPVGSRTNGRRPWNATLVVNTGRRPGVGLRDAWALVLRGFGEMGLEWSEPPEPVGGPWTSGPFDWPSRTAVVGRTLLVGDAAGYYDPLTGQGMYRALRSAELAAGTILEALSGRGGRPGVELSAAGMPRPRSGPDWSRLSGYQAGLRRELAPGRGLQRAIEAVVSRPFLREFALGILGRSPAAAATLIEMTGDLRQPWPPARRRPPGGGVLDNRGPLPTREREDANR